VPTDDRLGLDEHENLGPPSPEATQDDPEPAVGCRHPRSAACLHEDAELVPQREVLEHQVSPATARRTQDSKEQKEQAIHRPFRFEGRGGNVNRSEEDEELAKDR
jgi:hypothetical protein